MAGRIDPVLLKRFSTVFSERLWGTGESVSGPGSRKTNPMVLSAIQGLDTVIERFGLRSIVDIPCGDFNFLDEVLKKHPSVRYVGLDIVKELIDANRVRYPDLEFDQFDIVSDVPCSADLIFCKELLIHLSNEQVNVALSHMKKSGSTYLMVSNSFGVTNTELEHNYLGYARPIDLLAPPFSLPPPIWNNAFYAMWPLADCAL